MARLPQVGGDAGNWGTILNEFLSVEHEADGTLKTSGTLADKADDSEVVKLSGNQTVSGTKTFSSSPVVPDPTSDDEVASKSYVDNIASSGAPDADSTTKGLVQLAGDLSGTASSPQIAGGVIVDANISSSAAIAQSKVSNLTTDLAAKQPLDSDLTDIAGLTPTNDDVIQRKAGAWTNRTPTQLKTDLALTKSDVGLSNVDNTSDANKPVSTATQTALDSKASTSHTHNATDVDAGTLDIARIPTGTTGTTVALGDHTHSGYEPTLAAGTTSQYYRGDKSWQTLDKTAVGLANVDNTSDATKNSAAATLTNKTISGSDNTLSNIPQSAVTSLTTDLSTLTSRITLAELQPEQANRSTEGQETFSRIYAASNAVTMTSGVLKLSYVTAYRTQTINSLRTYTGAQAAAATPTLCKMGLYSVAGNGDLTRIGITANDTSMFSVVTTPYTAALTSGVSVTAGQRYVLAVLVVSTQTMPQLAGALPSIALVSTSPRIYGQITGQTDIPASISAGSITNSNTMHYGILIP